ncbi:LPS export ABC transporter ATP-binding protein [bacterium]|nr:LPS export ABC transporter ATP-binding protein [bacterium]
MDGSTILSAQNLVKTYGRRRVVDGVSYEVKRGEIVGLLGSNGAGKTTSFRMTCGMVTPNEGRVELNGKDVTRWPMYKRCRDGGMGYLAQDSSVFQKLTVEQNLIGIMELLHIDSYHRKQRCEELLERFDITHIRTSKAKSLSGGERRRLEIARCLVSDPEIIMLDEPFTGIDPVTVDSIQLVIRELRQSGISILITDHQAEKTLEIVDRCYVVHRGNILCHGTPDEVVRHPEAVTYYFGNLSRNNFGGRDEMDAAA